MKTDIRTIVGGTIFILLFAIVSNVVIKSSPADAAQSSNGSWACTTEVQVCADGSVVERTPPYCMFASCPN